jgi:hypothetical protein
MDSTVRSFQRACGNTALKPFLLCNSISKISRKLEVIVIGTKTLLKVKNKSIKAIILKDI